jgi:hypothetical protein
LSIHTDTRAVVHYNTACPLITRYFQHTCLRTHRTVGVEFDVTAGLIAADVKDTMFTVESYDIVAKPTEKKQSSGKSSKGSSSATGVCGCTHCNSDDQSSSTSCSDSESGGD